MSDQNMFEGDFPNYTSALSRSNNTRLQEAYPLSPVYREAPTKIGVADAISGLTRENVKEWYEANVMSGDFPAHSDFAAAIPNHGTGNYDYGTAPNLSDFEGRTIEGEALPSADGPGSSIVPSGLGPNVATMAKPGAAVPVLDEVSMIDATPTTTTPFRGAGDLSPHDTSASQGGGQPLTGDVIAGLASKASE